MYSPRAKPGGGRSTASTCAAAARSGVLLVLVGLQLLRSTTTMKTALRSSFSTFNSLTLLSNTTSKYGNYQSAGNDWFDPERWERLSSQLQCFYVENICHGAELFFYDKSNGGVPKKQPKWKIQRSGNHNGWRYINHAYPVDVLLDDSLNETDCYYSPIINHLVLHGEHISMLGEFYARVLPGLSRMMLNFTSGTGSRAKRRKWQEGTQLYVDAWLSPPTRKFF